MEIDHGTPAERLRKAAAWAHDDNRPLLARACHDGAQRIKELEAALNIIASGCRGDKILAEWEMSNIAAAVVGVK